MSPPALGTLPGPERRRTPGQGNDLEPDPRSHEGCHWLYVLSGRLRLVLSDQDIVLTAGEVAEFDTHLPHWFGNAEPRPVEFLSILGPQGERFHVTSSPSWTREIPTTP